MELHSLFTQSPILEAEGDLDKAKANLEGVKKNQNALAEMQVDVENLKPLMDDICFKLGIFAQVYSFVSPFLNVLFFLTNKYD